MVSVETAKAVVDIPAPYAGRIAKLYGKAGDIAHLGAPLVAFEGDSEAADAGTVVGKVEVGQKVVAEAPMAPAPLAGGIKATPAVRALARKLNVDLTMVTPTGRGRLAHGERRAARGAHPLGDRSDRALARRAAGDGPEHGARARRGRLRHASWTTPISRPGPRGRTR